MAYDDPAEESLNPYRAPEQTTPTTPLYRRLPYALRRAADEYWREIRRQGVEPLAHFRVWLAILFASFLAFTVTTMLVLGVLSHLGIRWR